MAGYARRSWATSSDSSARAYAAIAALTCSATFSRGAGADVGGGATAAGTAALDCGMAGVRSTAVDTCGTGGAGTIAALSTDLESAAGGALVRRSAPDFV